MGCVGQGREGGRESSVGRRLCGEKEQEKRWQWSVEGASLTESSWALRLEGTANTDSFLTALRGQKNAAANQPIDARPNRQRRPGHPRGRISTHAVDAPYRAA